MRSSVRGIAWLGVLVLVVACGRLDVPTPTVAAAASRTVGRPGADAGHGAQRDVSTVVLVGSGEAPQVTCGGGVMSGADIDYVANAQGVTDILAATRALTGVRATDVIVVEPTVTVVVRDGRPIWRGGWHDGGRGFLLGSLLSCTDAGIR